MGVARAVLPPITHPKIKTSGCMPTANPILIKIGVIIASTAVFDIKFVSTVDIRIPTIRRTMGEAFSPPKTPSIKSAIKRPPPLASSPSARPWTKPRRMMVFQSIVAMAVRKLMHPVTITMAAPVRAMVLTSHKPEIKPTTQKYEGRELPMSDIVQEANTALMLAAIEYDESEPWDGLVERRVREAVELALEEQRAEAEIEENMAARVNVLQTVSQMMAKELGREATLQELAAKMKMTEEEIKDIMKLALDALTVNGEGRALGETEDDTDSSNPIKDGWSMEER